MTVTLEAYGLGKITTDEKVALAAALWDSAHQDLENEPVEEKQLQEIRRRLAEPFNPADLLKWEDVRAELLSGNDQ